MEKSMTKNITRLEDAKALREMGMPLNLPVEWREFSPQSKKKIDAVAKLAAAFGKAVLKWVLNQNEKTAAAVWRSWGKLDKAVTETYTEPEWVEQSDDGSREMVNTEAVAVASFVAPFAVIRSQWEEILAALEDGEPVDLKMDEGPWPLGPFPGRVTLHGGGSPEGGNAA
jgi:hypothetical protein